MSNHGGPTVGAQSLSPPTPQEWRGLAKRGGDPILLEGEGRSILDASPIFVAADGKRRCLDTNQIVEQRKSARIALVASLKRHAGLEDDSADGLVNAIFVRQHPDGRYAETTILDAGMLRVAAALFDHRETASRLATFTKLGVEQRLTELLKLGKQIAAPDPSSESQSLAQTNVVTSSEDLGNLEHAFSILLLAHLRLVRTVSGETREMWRAGLRAADAETIGPLLAELKPYADTIYGPAAEVRDFKALATDLAAVRMPEEFIRDSQIKTANISEKITGDQFLMNALEDLACYMVARKWSNEMREDLLRSGDLNLSDGKPMGIRDDQHAKDILRSVVTRVNEIACREYDIALVPLLFEPHEGSASKDEETAGQYSPETRDIYLNFNRVLREEHGGSPGLIGTLVHEITHAYQHALALGTTKHRVPPGVRDAGAIFDFNVANYAPGAAVSVVPYCHQPMERHAHYVGYTVQRNIELALKARGAKRGLGDELSEDRSMIVSAWTLSSTEPNPISPLKSERDAMSRGTIFPRQPDTIPPWQRSADQPPSGQVTDCDEDDSS